MRDFSKRVPDEDEDRIIPVFGVPVPPRAQIEAIRDAIAAPKPGIAILVIALADDPEGIFRAMVAATDDENKEITAFDCHVNPTLGFAFLRTSRIMHPVGVQLGIDACNREHGTSVRVAAHRGTTLIGTDTGRLREALEHVTSPPETETGRQYGDAPGIAALVRAGRHWVCFTADPDIADAFAEIGDRIDDPDVCKHATAATREGELACTLLAVAKSAWGRGDLLRELRKTSPARLHDHRGCWLVSRREDVTGLIMLVDGLLATADD